MTKISQMVDDAITSINKILVPHIKPAKAKVTKKDKVTKSPAGIRQHDLMLNQLGSIKELWSTITVDKARKLYLEGKHKKLAIVLPHLRDDPDPFIQRLMESRLLLLGSTFDKSIYNDESDAHSLTFGADPEFILTDEKGINIVLFSSNMTQGGLVMSEATIGADYGLMEFRPAPSYKIDPLIKNLHSLHTQFDKCYPKLRIKRSEAEVFDHKKARILDQLEDALVDHGVNIAKGFFVEHAIDLDDESTYAKISISAYDEPLFGSNRKDILSAGGHIHVGGTFIKMMSLEQMKEFIRRIDVLVQPMCTAVETPAAALRKEVYGFPGEFRIKPYGLEYRSPSNAIFWQENEKVLGDILKVIEKEAKSFFIK